MHPVDNLKAAKRAIEAQTRFYTEAQQVLRQAKNEARNSLGEKMLRKGAAMLDSPDFNALPEHCQRDLSHQYAEAFRLVSGVGA